MMKTQTKIYLALAVAAIFGTGILGGAAWSNHKIQKLQKTIDIAKHNADLSAQAANENEKQAEIYRAKTEYLEQQLTEIQAIARKQDEQLEKLNISSSRARADLERTRNTRTVTATAAELCAKLADLGHPCE